MEITVVGSGTGAPHPDRVGPAHYAETEGLHILFDCGSGAVHHLARFGIPWNRTTHVVLSHFHTDHIADLPSLLFALKYGTDEARREPLTILAPAGIRTLLGRLADAFGAYIRDPGFELAIRELESGEDLELAPRARLRTHVTPHTAASLAYRLETPRGALGYTGDTGESAELGAFFRGVALLVAECSLPDERAIETHLTPSRVAALACVAEPRCLLLTHLYPLLDGVDVPALVRRAGWDGDVRVAYDGLRLRL